MIATLEALMLAECQRGVMIIGVRVKDP